MQNLKLILSASIIQILFTLIFVFIPISKSIGSDLSTMNLERNIGNIIIEEIKELPELDKAIISFVNAPLRNFKKLEQFISDLRQSNKLINNYISREFTPEYIIDLAETINHYSELSQSEPNKKIEQNESKIKYNINPGIDPISVMALGKIILNKSEYRDFIIKLAKRYLTNSEFEKFIAKVNTTNDLSITTGEYAGLKLNTLISVDYFDDVNLIKQFIRRNKLVNLNFEKLGSIGTSYSSLSICIYKAYLNKQTFSLFYKLAKVLINAGIDPDIKNSINGTNPLILAKILAQSSFINLLIRAGANRDLNKKPSKYLIKSIQEYIDPNYSFK